MVALFAVCLAVAVAGGSSTTTGKKAIWRLPLHVSFILAGRQQSQPRVRAPTGTDGDDDNERQRSTDAMADGASTATGAAADDDDDASTFLP
jgi:hypothetical protein